MDTALKTKTAADPVKILLVDDLKANLLALEGLLRRNDILIFKANSGTEALEFMIANEFALALIDVQMPGMSGFELAELMRGTRQTRNIPIIFVTATAIDQSFSFKGYESGAVDFLLKPLDAFAVKSKVSIFIEQYRQKEELKRIQAALTQAVQIRDEFLSIASHELKTPLTSLKLQAQLRMRSIKNGDAAAFTLEQLNTMFSDDAKQLEQITHLIDDMLDITRITSGKLSMNFEPFDLCELVSEHVTRSLDPLAVAGGPIQIEVCEPLIGCWDRFRIEQVVMNLLTNARRYGEEKPISLQVKSVPGGAQIIVRDQGQGIARENQERIFQRFERVTGSDSSGLGLGLYIVRQILEAHQGSIRVESELGKGSTFIVELPTSVSNEKIQHAL